MSGLIEIVRAKSEGDKPLLKDHILETINRVVQLKEFMERNNLKINQSEKFFESLILATFLHDLGKINYRYQRKFYHNEMPTELVNFMERTKKIELRHEILSAIWCSLLLEENDEWNKKIRTAVLLHHYNDFYINEKDLDEILEEYPQIKEYFGFICEKWDKIESFLKDLKESITKNFDSDYFIKKALEKISTSRDRVIELEKRINERVDISEFAEFYEINNENPDYEFLVFLGALRRCDYSASGDFNIELIDATLNDVFSKIDESIEEKRKVWDSDWQWELLSKVKNDSLVLVAPTGSGKTEFALLWGRKILNKFIYTVPLRVALNDLYLRFKEYMGDNFSDKLGLLHSTAFIEYLKEEREGGELDVGSKVNSSSILAHPVTLATPDQIFLASLHYYGSDKVISIYPYSAFVLDEIQSYTPEMAAIIIKTLKIIENLGGKILVMTATLPPYYRPFFSGEKFDLSDFKDKHKILEKFKLNVEICDTEKIKQKVKNYELKRHRIQVVEDYLVRYKETNESENKNKKANKNKTKNTTEDENSGIGIEVNKAKLISLIDEIRSKGKRSIFVILNNVSKAISVYEELKKLNEASVVLLHSRLLEIEKERRIKEINEKVGKEDIIVVSTQIVEASVNLDFDAMITEISPIDSQIQRWGRVYRNKKNDYNDEQPNIYVFLGEKDENERIKFDRGTLAIYGGEIGKNVLEKTAEELIKRNGNLMNYEDERKLIEDVFNSKVDGKELWKYYLEEILKTLDFLNYFYAEKKSQAQRIFREVAGFQVVVPNVMDLENNDSLEKIFEIIKSENKDTSWKEIEEKTGMSMWEIKSALYRYSVNTPVYYFQTLQREGKLTEFKGFYILTVDEESARIIRDYGLDKYMKEKLAEKDEEDHLENIY